MDVAVFTCRLTGETGVAGVVSLLGLREFFVLIGFEVLGTWVLAASAGYVTYALEAFSLFAVLAAFLLGFSSSYYELARSAMFFSWDEIDSFLGVSFTSTGIFPDIFTEIAGDAGVSALLVVLLGFLEVRLVLMGSVVFGAGVLGASSSVTSAVSYPSVVGSSFSY